MTGGFMPSEAMITRPRDAAWERLAIGQRVTVTPEGRPGAVMRVTSVIPHVSGDETYVLRDIAVTQAQLEAEEAEFRDMMRGIASCGTCNPPVLP